MNVILHDFQDGSDDPYDGLHVDDSDILCDILDQLQLREPFILELEGDNGYRLTVGIGGPVQLHSTQFERWRAALRDGRDERYPGTPEPENRVLLSGGQGTEIRGSQCVPYAVLRSVATCFLQTGDRSTEVDWVEV
jgi:hypothetical protein